MKTNNKKLYKKALNLYEKGNYKKALQICDYEITNNINNNSIINLKGLILYITGNLNEAKQLWKLNLEINNDGISEKYLLSTDKDENKKQMYLKALKNFNENKIKLAMEELNKCMESDFNSIDVNILYASCLMKLGEYSKADLALSKVFSIDKNNKEALNLRNSMVKLGVIKNKRNISFIKICLVASLIIIICITTVKIYPLIRNNSIFSKTEEKQLVENQTVNEESLPNTEENKNEIEIDNKEKEQETKKAKEFKKEELINNINNKDYNAIENILNEYDINTLSINEKSVYNSGIDFMKKEGIELCYKEAGNYIKENEFSKADNLLKISEKYAENSYLMEHIIYFRASCNENMGDIEKAINFYTNYINQYSQGEYCEEVLYRLAVNYEKIDKEKAIKYAQIIQDKFADSMYNNSIIKNILN